MAAFSLLSADEEMSLYEDGMSVSIAMSNDVLDIHGGGIYWKASSSTNRESISDNYGMYVSGSNR